MKTGLKSIKIILLANAIDEDHSNCHLFSKTNLHHSYGRLMGIEPILRNTTFPGAL